MEEFVREQTAPELSSPLDADAPPVADAAPEQHAETPFALPVADAAPEDGFGARTEPEASERNASVAQTVEDAPQSVTDAPPAPVNAAEIREPEPMPEAPPAQLMPDAQSLTETPFAPPIADAAPEQNAKTPPAQSTPEAQSLTERPSAPPFGRRAVRAGLRRRRRRRWIGGFVCGMAVTGLLVLSLRLWALRRASVSDGFVWDFRENYEQSNSREDLSVRIPAWPIGQGAAFRLLREHGDAQTAQEVYRNVNPSVLTVIVNLSNETAAVGTGVIFSDDGYFLTNYHVIQGGAECRAMLDSGRSYPALFVAGDERNDLAVLKMDASGPFPAAQFGDSELLTVGDPVYAIGNPLGIEFRGTLTNGIVSAIDRDVLVDGRTMTLLQTNAALNSGNSGGPLINEYGQVIGINVVKMSSRRSTVEGLGFAIPSAAMERLVNDLLTYGENQPEPTIGVSVDSFGTEVEPDVWGIGVLKVEPNSAAEKGGVKVGDYIISADAETVSSSRDLLRVRRRYHVGERMTLTLWRDGERVDVAIAFTE